MVGVNKFTEFIKWLRSGKAICLLTHRNADPDAIAALVALRYLILKTIDGRRVELVLPEGMEKASKRIISELLPHIEWREELGVCDRVVVVDSASPSQLGKVEFKNLNYGVVDHHEVNELVSRASASLHLPEATSCSEIVFELSRVSGVKFPPEILTLLITGILYDTKFLRRANAGTFRTLSQIIEKGGDYSKAYSLLVGERVVEYSERVARLKGISRTGVYSLNGKYLMAITCIGAFESSTLKVIVEAGAHVAIAVARRKDGVRVTVRCSQELVRDLGFPVAAELTSYLGKVFKGSGGGHSCAAGARFTEFSPTEFLKAVEKFFNFKGVKVRELERGRWVEECG